MTNQRTPYHHGDLRTALLAEAVTMIADGGLESMTMRAISARLGVSRAAPYRHFPDKSALLVAVAAAGFERLTARLQSTDAGAPRSGMGRFQRMGEEYVRFALENPAHYRLMYGKEALTREEVPELRQAGEDLLALLVGVIRAHQRDGQIKRGDAEALAFVAWSGVHGLASLFIEGQIGPANDVDELIRQTTRTLLDGLRVRHRTGA